MYGLIDDSSKASWALELSTHWMNFYMGILGASLVFVVAGIVAVKNLDAATAGFSLSFALRCTGALTKVLKSMASVELGFNVCERVMDYTQIETEPQDGEDALEEWPSARKIEIQNLTVKYVDSTTPALDSLTLDVGPGERIGIVGRTGSGKSTLVSALFRLLEPSEGKICIDDIDISSLKLSQLRSRLEIIPQDPPLFS